jgi:hypothetical protein
MAMSFLLAFGSGLFPREELRAALRAELDVELLPNHGFFAVGLLPSEREGLFSATRSSSHDALTKSNEASTDIPGSESSAGSLRKLDKS